MENALSDIETFDCESLEEFIAEARRALVNDHSAVVTLPDGREMPVSEFLTNYDRNRLALPSAGEADTSPN